MSASADQANRNAAGEADRTIPVEEGMAGAFWKGVNRYMPACPGMGLSAETGDPETTAKNLDRLFKSSPRRSILAVINRGAPGVLVVFKTGESYIASGFSVGTDGPETAALARFLTDHNDGDWVEDFDWMRQVLSSVPTDLIGPVPLPREKSTE